MSEIKFNSTLKTIRFEMGLSFALPEKPSFKLEQSEVGQ